MSFCKCSPVLAEKWAATQASLCPILSGERQAASMLMGQEGRHLCQSHFPGRSKGRGITCHGHDIMPCRAAKDVHVVMQTVHLCKCSVHIRVNQVLDHRSQESCHTSMGSSIPQCLVFRLA